MKPRTSSHSLIFIVSGPAGIGKTTLCERLLRGFDTVSRIVTATTRPPRPGEVDGRDYYFLAQKDFEAKQREDGFYESAEVHGRRYGTPKDEVTRKLDLGMDLLMNIDVQGAAAFREAERADPRIRGRLVSVFVRPEGMEDLKTRILSRGHCDGTELKRRMASAEEELKRFAEFDYCIISGSRDEDFDAFRSIYIAERLKVR